MTGLAHHRAVLSRDALCVARAQQLLDRVEGAQVEPSPVPEFSSEDQGAATSGPRARWSDLEDAQFIAMKAEGKTLREIAQALGRPHAACGYRWAKVLRARVDAAADGAVVELAGPAPDGAAPVAPAPVARSHDFTPEQDARLRRYMAQDLGIGGAAALLQLPRDQVAARWAQLEAAGDPQ